LRIFLSEEAEGKEGKQWHGQMIEMDEERGKTRGDGSHTYEGWCISTDNNRLG